MALSGGEQALLNLALKQGKSTVSSSFVPAESLARVNAELAKRQSQQAPAQTALTPAPQTTTLPTTSGLLAGTVNTQASRPANTVVLQSRPAETVAPSGMLTNTPASTLTRPTNVNIPALSSVTEKARTPAPQIPAPRDTIQDRIKSIYETELGRSGAQDQEGIDYWTNQVLQGNLTLDQVQQTVNVSPEGIVYDAYTGLLQRAPDPQGRDYFVDQLQTGVLTPEQLRTTIQQSPEFFQPIESRKQAEPLTLLENVRDTGSMSDLGTLFYKARKDNTQLPADFIQSVAETRTTDPTVGYEFLIGAQAYSEGLDALDQAIESGDQAKAVEIRNALENEQDFYGYYLENIASNDNQHHENLRKETLTGSVYGIGDPKGGIKGSLERGITRLGDAIGDVVENPYVQAAVTFANPAAGSVLNAYATLDSGEELSPAQVIAAASGANDLLSTTAGSSLLSSLPQGVQDFVTSVKDFADGATGRAVAALKKAFPNVDTEKLAEYEDNFKEFLAGGEDVIRDVVGDENIEAISSNIAGLEDAIRAIAESTGETYQEVSNRLAGVEDFIRENIGDDNIEAISSSFAGFEDLLRGQFGSQQEQLDALAAALAADRGPSFTPQRGYQPGLAVNTEFDQPERSAVLDILNQPSSMRRA